MGLRQRWAAGEAAHGAWLAIPSAFSAEAVGRAGFDFVCIDMQHGLADYAQAAGMLQALHHAASGSDGDSDGPTPLVRVPWNEPGSIGRMLDAGAMGIVVPMVNAPDEARRAVAACRYPPAGQRSFGPTGVMLRSGSDYYASANERVLCIPMIETREAVERLDDILAVPGVDAIYVGPSDLSISHGLPPGNHDAEPVFTQALERIASGCREHGVVAGIHASARLAERRREQGYRMITVTTDLLALQRQLARDRAEALGTAAGSGPGSDRIY